jgi:ParB family chromosome partitioning protein
MASATMKITQLPLKALKLADNVRKTPGSAESDAGLKASIKAVGLLTPLLVKPAGKDKYKVVAGGRRTRALTELVSEKALPKEYKAPCIVLAADADDIEIGLVENAQRDSMHPIDQFEAFHALHYKNNLAIPDIAARHGISQTDVRKLLALGGVHQDLRAACRNGEVDVENLAIYATVDDQKRQLQTFKALKKAGGENNAWQIRRMLNEDCYSASDKRVVFIGVDAYRDAGGAVEGDLFEGETRLVDKALVDRLVDEKLREAAEKHGKGWKWAEVNLDYKQHASPHEVLPSQRGGYTPEQKETAGIIVTLEHNGQLNVIKGLVRKADAAAAKKAAAKKDKDPADKSPREGDDDGALPSDYPGSLKTDLYWYHLVSSKAAIHTLAPPELLVQLLMFNLCWNTFNADAFEQLKALHLTFKAHEQIDSSRDDIDGSPAERVLGDKLDALDQSWLVAAEPGDGDTDEAVSFRKFLELPSQTQLELTAFCVAYGLQRKPTNPLLDFLLQKVGANLAVHWRPTAENFFSRITQPERLAIAAEILQLPEAPAAQKKMKKGELCLWLEDQVKAMPAETCWMPRGFKQA